MLEQLLDDINHKHESHLKCASASHISSSLSTLVVSLIVETKLSRQCQAPTRVRGGGSVRGYNKQKDSRLREDEYIKNTETS